MAIPFIKFLVMKKIIFSLLFASATLLNAQVLGTRLPSARVGGENSKFTFGGYAGLGGAFGSGFGGTSVFVIPRVGYLLTENLELGLSGNLTWQSSRYFSSTMVGVGPFANYYIGRSFFLSGMFQQFFFNQRNRIDNLTYKNNESTLYLGGGYMQRLGERTYMQIGGMYNVLYNRDRSAFGGAFIPSIGVVYGL